MRIIVNDIAASHDAGGAFTVLTDLYQTVLKTDTENEWIFLLADNYFKTSENVHIKTFPAIKKSWFKRLQFDLFIGKKIINSLDGDVYVSLQNTATLGLNIPQIVYLHQSIPYQNTKTFSLFKRKEMKLAIIQKIMGKFFNFLFKQSKAHIVVQTNWMKKALQEKIGTNNQITVIPPDLSFNLSPEKKATPNRQQFFYPAALQVYKNHNILLEAANLLRDRQFKDFQIEVTLTKKEAPILAKHPNFICSGALSLEAVYQRYINKTLLFPSYIETFGLPLMEARQFNSFIIAADTVFAREVLDDYKNAYFFNYQNAIELADQMEKIMSGTSPHYSAVKSIPNRQNPSSWLSLIHLILDKKK